MSKTVAITIGDIHGIGIDILINCWKKKQINNFILFTDIVVLKKYLKKRKIELKVNKINNEYKILNSKNYKFNVFSYNSKSDEDNTYRSLEYAYKFCKKKICIGIITLPLRKDKIKKKVDKKFIGQTEFFQKIDNKRNSNMILYHDNIIVSPLTTHIEIKKLPKIVSNKLFIKNQITNLYQTLIKDFNIINPKVVISGFNPHSGENGLIGTEEKEILKPIMNKLRKKGINIDGPLSADSILLKNNLKKYDCFIFLFHDQALIPFKYISQFSGVNFTGNLNIIRTSPDHGTAYNLIGKKNISSTSFLNCYKLIKKIYKNRIINDKT